MSTPTHLPSPTRSRNATTDDDGRTLMDSAWPAVAAIVGALLALAGAIFTSRSSPYAAVVDRVVKLEAQRELDVLKIEKLQHKVGELEDGRANDQTEISGLQRRIAGVFEDRDDLVRYVTVLRAWIAAGAKPPAPSVPEHLADVVPQWVPGDGAEPPPRRQIEDATD